MPTYTTLDYPARARGPRLLAAVLLCGVLATSLTAQPRPVPDPLPNVAALVAAGDRESVARKPGAALELYERALAIDPRHYAALCKAAQEAVDLGEFEPRESVRIATYARAVDYARRAIAVNATDPEGHFHLARALGRTALALGPRDRVKYAIDVRAAALEAVRLAPRHAGALHVLGVWNAEVMRLNGFSRAVAKTFMGGKVLDNANWPDAVRYLEQAVAIEPARLVHRLDLARIYRDTNRKAEARASYQAALTSPLTDANDATYRQLAEQELRALR